jgi:hypothetical protein
MKIQRVPVVIVVVVMSWICVAGTAHAQALVSVGAGGLYPPGTVFNSVPITGLQSGYGIEITSTGSAIGQFCTILLGLAGERIAIEGNASSGSRLAPNIVTFSGTCSVNGPTGRTAGVPFTATVTTDINDQGSIGLIIGANKLPDGIVTTGSMTIK